MTLKTLIGSIFLLLILSPNVHARNDYLQDGYYTCREGDLRIRGQYSDTTNPYGTVYPNSSSNNYNQYNDRYDRSISIEYTMFLGSNCTPEAKRTMRENQMLKQQIELMKVCRRYGGRDLPPQFAMLQHKCAGINKDNGEHFSNLRLFDILVLVEKKCIQGFVVAVDSEQCQRLKVVLYFCVYLEMFLMVGYDMTVDV